MQADRLHSLPEPDAESAAHCKRVAAYLRERIAAGGGRVSFGGFMHDALYAPGLGYYAAGTTKFGAEGDFVTAPEISPLFGRIVARQLVQVLEATDGALLEFGAGSGRLAVDLLKALERLDSLPSCYRILEPSASLRHRQRALLEQEVPQHLPLVSWLDRLPEAHRGVILANEVLDAMPVERFRRTAGGTSQLWVTVRGDGFEFVEDEATPVVASAVADVERDLGRRLPQDYVSEICLPAPHWLAGVAGTLERGVALLFDYGVSRREYYAPDRSGGWLRCHFRHHAHDDPLILTGIQDITAWVDFTAVAAAAVDHGLRVAGFVNQTDFFLHGGLAEELDDFVELPPAAQLELSAQVKMLTLPGEMGESFKCLAVSRGAVPVPAVFAAADRSASL